MCKASPTADFLGGSGCRQFELGQVRNDSFVKIDGTALNLLENQGRGHYLRDGTKKEAGILMHRCSCDYVRRPVGHDGLVAAVVVTGKISRNPLDSQ